MLIEHRVYAISALAADNEYATFQIRDVVNSLKKLHHKLTNIILNQRNCYECRRVYDFSENRTRQNCCTFYKPWFAMRRYITLLSMKKSDRLGHKKNPQSLSAGQPIKTINIYQMLSINIERGVSNDENKTHHKDESCYLRSM